MALCDYCLSIQKSLPNLPTLAECAYWLTDAYRLQTFQMDCFKIKIHACAYPNNFSSLNLAVMLMCVCVCVCACVCVCV